MMMMVVGVVMMVVMTVVMMMCRAVRPRLWPVEGAVLKSLQATGLTEQARDINKLFLLQFDVLTHSPLELQAFQ